MVVSYKDLQNLAGYTHLVKMLDEVIHDVQHGKFKRGKVEDNKILEKYIGGTVIQYS
jgi:hypothetical protein